MTPNLQTTNLGHRRNDYDLSLSHQRITPVRHYGRWIFGLIWITVGVLLVIVFANAKIDYSVVKQYVFSGTILIGLLNTLKISAFSMIIAIVLGLIAAIVRQSPSRLVSAPADFYVWLFRSTPVILQLLIWYNIALVFPTIDIPGLGAVSTNQIVTPFLAALLGLSINAGAYMAEIIRAGILSVDYGQREAAEAMGLTQWDTTMRVILPQAMRAIIPPTGNEFIALLKYSSLAYVIQYHELLYSAVSIYSVNLRVIELLFTVTIWYLVLTSLASIGQYYLERYVGRSTARTSNGKGLSERIMGNLKFGRPA